MTEETDNKQEKEFKQGDSESEPKAVKEKKKKRTLSEEEYRKLKEAERLGTEYLDQLLRTQAEFENFKKRMARDRMEFLKYANEGLISELLDIIDNFERAFDSATKMNDFKSLHQGVEMILKQIHGLLKDKGVAKIESLGKKFDPTKHEAIMWAADDDKPEDTIIEELQTGYTLNERVIRPARVKVSKKNQETEDKEDKPEDSPPEADSPSADNQ